MLFLKMEYKTEHLLPKWEQMLRFSAQMLRSRSMERSIGSMGESAFPTYSANKVSILDLNFSAIV